jgi:hypothetical protein
MTNNYSFNFVLNLLSSWFLYVAICFISYQHESCSLCLLWMFPVIYGGQNLYLCCSFVKIYQAVLCINKMGKHYMIIDSYEVTNIICRSITETRYFISIGSIRCDKQDQQDVINKINKERRRSLNAL